MQTETKLEIAQAWRRAVSRGTAALLAGTAAGLIGLLGVWAGYPWLFASLGPTLAVQSTLPELHISRPWNVAVGHLIAVAVALLAVYATGAVHLPPFSDSHPLFVGRVGAAAMAITLSLGIEFLLNASHAPAASTALLVALGLVPPDWSGILTLLCGIGLVTLLGELIRRAHRIGGRPCEPRR